MIEFATAKLHPEAKEGIHLGPVQKIILMLSTLINKLKSFDEAIHVSHHRWRQRLMN
jgi:hypothetical protein